MKLMGVKRNFQVVLVPNYRAFRITVIYVMLCLLVHTIANQATSFFLTIRLSQARPILQIAQLRTIINLIISFD